MRTKVFLTALTTFLTSFLLISGTTSSAGFLQDDNRGKKEKEEEKEKKEQIVVDQEVYDFETISESAGKVTATFKLTNNTKGPVLVTNVRVTCGCTEPVWTKKPIEPGKTGEVQVTYDPEGRRYPFSKSITIYTTGIPEVIVVKIKGVVE